MNFDDLPSRCPKCGEMLMFGFRIGSSINLMCIECRWESISFNRHDYHRSHELGLSRHASKLAMQGIQECYTKEKERQPK